MLYILYFLYKVRKVTSEIFCGYSFKSTKQADAYFDLQWRIRDKKAFIDAITAPLLRVAFSPSLLRSLITVEPIDKEVL